MSDVNETLQELLDRRLREMGGRHEPRTLRSAYMALPKDGDWVTYEVVRRATKGHTRITDRAARTLATMLAVGEDEVRRAAGQRPKLGPFDLPPRADRLSESERGVVISVVDAILSAAEGDSRPSTQSDARLDPVSPPELDTSLLVVIDTDDHHQADAGPALTSLQKRAARKGRKQRTDEPGDGA